MPGSFLTDDLDTLLLETEFATGVIFEPYVGYQIEIFGIYDEERIVIDPYTNEQTVLPAMMWVKWSDVETLIRHKSKIIIDSVYFDIQKFENEHDVGILTLQREVS